MFYLKSVVFMSMFLPYFMIFGTYYMYIFILHIHLNAKYEL